MASMLWLRVTDPPQKGRISHSYSGRNFCSRNLYLSRHAHLPFLTSGV